MSTPPPAPPPPTQGYERPYYGSAVPPLPPVNGELIVFLLAWLVVGLVALATDEVGPRHFVVASVALAVAYMLSRGIAKAGKVFEGR